MARVFLSHAGPDKPVVRRIAAALRAAGHDPWLDEDEILVGESIPAAVERGLRDADFVVFCLSKAAAARGWVEAERDATLMQQFREREERILPVRLEDVTPPGLVRLLAHVDLFPDEQAFLRGIARLTHSIAAHTARRAMKGEATAVNSQTATTAAVGAGSVAGRPTARNVAPLTPEDVMSVMSVRRPREVPERFLVALSFSGAEREFVRAIAEAVEYRLGSSSVFLDEWYEFYIGGHDADVKLQRIYSAGCELAVVCVSATYGSKAWTRAEHEAIRARLMQARTEEDPRQRDRVFSVRVGDGDVAGIPFNAIVPDVRGRTPDQVAELIVDRLRFVMGSAWPAAQVSTAQGSGGSTAPPALRAPARRIIAPTPTYLNAEVQAASEQLERARQRKQNLRNAGIGTEDVDREILELRRKLREGGQLRAGDALGDDRYLLVKQVGRGGFAVVWEAFDRAEQQRVAIKVLHHHLASDPQRCERFFRGARVILDLNHPAIVRVLDPRGEDEGFRYFVMELVHGGNLREAVLGNRVAAAHRLALILQVGEALAEAHRQRLVHRDIKPANVLLDDHGNAKLTDFDLVGAHDTTGGTRTGALGTVVYAAPECLDRPQDATARADVFGLGMTAIFCLAGHDLSMDTLVDRAGALAQLDCTEPVRKVLERAVEWKPDRRFADAAEMVGALRDALDDSSPSVVTDDGHAARTEPEVQATSMPVAISPRANQRQRGDVEAGLRSQPRPRWAVASDKDDYGEWAAFEVKGVRHRMRWIPPGTFLMGSPEAERGRYDDEGPQHDVTLSRGYWLGETPATQALWVAVMGTNPSRFRGNEAEDLQRPVEQVSWDDCQEFLDRLNPLVPGLAARLPTEVEWERACRGGTTNATWAGELSGDDVAPELDAIAWYGGNSGAKTHPVGLKAPNPYGLYDMLGNVWEWCADEQRVYEAEPVTDPALTGKGPFRVYRGGSWDVAAGFVRAAYRDAYNHSGRIDLGFRLAAGQSVPSKSSRSEEESVRGDQGPGAVRNASWEIGSARRAALRTTSASHSAIELELALAQASAEKVKPSLAPTPDPVVQTQRMMEHEELVPAITEGSVVRAKLVQQVLSLKGFSRIGEEGEHLHFERDEDGLRFEIPRAGYLLQPLLDEIAAALEIPATREGFESERLELMDEEARQTRTDNDEE